MPGGTAHRPPAGRDARVAPLRAELDAHQPADDRERSSKAVALAHLDEHDRPFDESAHPTHVTASAVVVGRRGVLLHRHRKLGRWMQPGGHVDPGEDPPSAAARECREETGLVVGHPGGRPCLVHVDVHDAADGHVHIDLRYLVEGPDAPPAPSPGESQEVSWMSWEEAGARADGSLIGALRAARLVADREGLAAADREPV